MKTNLEPGWGKGKSLQTQGVLFKAKKTRWALAHQQTTKAPQVKGEINTLTFLFRK